MGFDRSPRLPGHHETIRIELAPQPAHAPAPSIAEQMGVDPISKLAAAIHDLAEALRNPSINRTR